MGVATVDVLIDNANEFLARVSMNPKVILQTLKWYYQPEKRRLLKEIIRRKFEEENVKKEFKKYIELELKHMYGLKEEVINMEVVNVEFENQTIYVYYKFKTKKKKDKKIEDLVF